MYFQLKELYRYRSLIGNLVVRELKARYRGSMLGLFWSFLNPLLLVSVYTLVFSVYLRFGMEKDYIPHLISGLLPWLWFSSSLLEASGSIISGGNLIKKILFPAEILPLVVVLSNCVNFLLSLPILLLLIVFFKSIHLSILALPIIICIQLVLSAGLAFMLSALCVHYRDIQHLLGNVLTFWFFLTPIIYPLERIPEKFRFLVSVNPVAPLIIAYQDIFYRGQFPNFPQLFIVAIMAVIMYTLGSAVFEKYRGTFAEEV